MSLPGSGLAFAGVEKSYGGKSVLRGFTGDFVPGRIAALVGPNGAGKTTLLRIAAGLQRSDAGGVTGGSTLYYGGFDALPLHGTVRQFRAAVGLAATSGDDRRILARLSRGELQRVGLDIALELAPDVLLLDEPWTALEPDARAELNERLQSAARSDRVVICSSHDLDEVARVADDVVFLTRGVADWKRREDFQDGAFDRDDLVQTYRSNKT